MMINSNRKLEALCQRCGRWREQVNRETEWTCRECHLEQQGQRLLALVEARGRELAEARRGQEEAREVAAWLLAEWTEPVNWGEAIESAEAKFGSLDWLREGKG